MQKRREMLLPKISIIVPVYNAENFLKRCIESIITQSFEAFELILVDDGSTDNSPMICDLYAVKDSRVSVIHQKNRGVSVARNNGIRRAKGQYITFIDADDWIASEYIEILYNNLIKYQAEISVCDVQWINQDEEIKRTWNNYVRIFNSNEAICEYGLNSYNKFRLTVGKLVKTEIIKQFMFSEAKMVAEDMAVIYKWYYSAGRIVDSDVALYYYYQNPNSVSHAIFNEKKIQFLQTMEEVLQFLEHEKFDEVYEKLLHEYLFKAAWQYENFLEVLHNTEVANKIKKNIRILICKNIKKHYITLEKDIYALNIGYPMLMSLYWKIDKIKKLTIEKGFINTVAYIIKQLRKRINV